MYIQYATWLHVFVQETRFTSQPHEAGIVGSELSEAQLWGSLRHTPPKTNMEPENDGF